jgi:glutathione synthase
MKIGFVVNDVATEQPQYTTNRLALAAKEQGHEAWLMGVGDFSYKPDGTLATTAVTAAGKRYR